VDGDAEALSSGEEEVESQQQLFGELERQIDEIASKGAKDERKLIEREMEEAEAVMSEMRGFTAAVMKRWKERQQSKARLR
jgi:hypothetical protein